MTHQRLDRLRQLYESLGVDRPPEFVFGEQVLLQPVISLDASKDILPPPALEGIWGDLLAASVGNFSTLSIELVAGRQPPGSILIVDDIQVMSGAASGRVKLGWPTTSPLSGTSEIFRQWSDGRLVTGVAQGTPVKMARRTAATAGTGTLVAVDLQGHATADTYVQVPGRLIQPAGITLVCEPSTNNTSIAVLARYRVYHSR